MERGLIHDTSFHVLEQYDSDYFSKELSGFVETALLSYFDKYRKRHL
jgi:hypothetical protein